MKNRLIIILISFLLITSKDIPAEDIIVFTANQTWLSRVYLMRMDGTVIKYFEYDFYRFTDLEVINNELYAAEAFAPRVYKINLETGELVVIIDDWSLFYFYDIGFDGDYLYTTEWDMHQYSLNGTHISSSPFEGTPTGGASNNNYYWTLNDAGAIQCWDFLEWPNKVEVPENNFSPPTPDCRGLWHDGQYFWSAESKQGLGHIYKFDSNGTVVQQWLEPSFSGWGACVIKDFITDIPEDTGELPEEVVLEANFPNPFHTSTTIRFTLPRASEVCLNISNSSGKLVATLLEEKLPSGEHQVEYNGNGLTPGIYFLKLFSEDNDYYRKMVKY
jgi:hypothetical protein